MPIDSSLAPFGQVLTKLCHFEDSGLPGVQHSPAQSSTVQHLFWTALPEVPKLQMSITFSSHLRLRCSLAFRIRHNMRLHILMSIFSCVLLFVGERRSQPHQVLSHSRPTRVLSPMAKLKSPP